MLGTVARAGRAMERPDASILRQNGAPRRDGSPTDFRYEEKQSAKQSTVPEGVFVSSFPSFL